MKKIISILVLILITSSIYSESISDSLIRVSRQKVKENTPKVQKQCEDMYKTYRSTQLEDTKKNMDTTVQLAKDCGNILKKEVKQYGWKRMIQINANLFLPVAIFIILTLIWMKNKKKV